MKQSDENARKTRGVVPKSPRETTASSRSLMYPKPEEDVPFRRGPSVPLLGSYEEDGEESFSSLLCQMLAKSGLSIRQAANRSWLDHSYLSRLVSQDWDPLNPQIRGSPGRVRRPSRDVVLRLGLGLSLTVDETDELLLAAGYPPLVKG